MELYCAKTTSTDWSQPQIPVIYHTWMHQGGSRTSLPFDTQMGKQTSTETRQAKMTHVCGIATIGGTATMSLNTNFPAVIPCGAQKTCFPFWSSALGTMQDSWKSCISLVFLCPYSHVGLPRHFTVHDTTVQLTTPPTLGGTNSERSLLFKRRSVQSEYLGPCTGLGKVLVVGKN